MGPSTGATARSGDADPGTGATGRGRGKAQKHQPRFPRCHSKILRAVSRPPSPTKHAVLMPLLHWGFPHLVCAAQVHPESTNTRGRLWFGSSVQRSAQCPPGNTHKKAPLSARGPRLTNHPAALGDRITGNDTEAGVGGRRTHSREESPIPARAHGCIY